MTTNGRVRTKNPIPVQEAPQPDTQFVIQALVEENRSLNDNKLYLLAILKQIQTEFTQAQEQWELEKASLLARSEK